MAWFPGLEVRGKEAVQETVNLLPREVSKAGNAAVKKGSSMVTKFWRLNLSGPATARRLGVGTGQLRRSIRAARVNAETYAVGSNMPYAAVHEYGFTGTVAVRSHTRRSFGKVRRLTRLKSGKNAGALRMRRVSVFKGRHEVRAHFRKMNVPQRPHRAPTIRQVTPPLIRLFEGHVDEAVRQSKALGDRLKGQQQLKRRLLGSAARRSR